MGWPLGYGEHSVNGDQLLKPPPTPPFRGAILTHHFAYGLSEGVSRG